MIARTEVAPRPRLLCIDPGSSASGVVLLDMDIPSGPVVHAEKMDNSALLSWLSHRALPRVDGSLPLLTGAHVMVVEFPHARGMPASNDLFRTVWWVGRFREAWTGDYAEVDRKDVKLAMCGVGSAKDSNIRAAILDRFGGKDRAVGKKANPGPLYGVRADAWSALALGLTYSESNKEVSRV